MSSLKRLLYLKSELCNVKMQVLRADLLERADNSALEYAPKPLNRLSVDRADNVLALRVVNGRVREFLADVSVADPLIGASRLTSPSTATASGPRPTSTAPPAAAAKASSP
jgi:hypothetical protein